MQQYGDIIIKHEENIISITLSSEENIFIFPSTIVLRKRYRHAKF